MDHPYMAAHTDDHVQTAVNTSQNVMNGRHLYLDLMDLLV